jgi:hypothetical protein
MTAFCQTKAKKYKMYIFKTLQSHTQYGICTAATKRDMIRLPQLSFRIDTAPSFLSNGHQGFLSWGKITRALNSPLYAEVQKEGSCTSTPSICLHGVDRDNFTLLYFTLL